MGWLNGERALLEVSIAIATEDELEVRKIRAEERLSSCFSIHVVAMSPNPDIDFDEVVGAPASVEVATAQGLAGFLMGATGEGKRVWQGVVSEIRQVSALTDASALAEYELTVVPELWLLTQRRNYRIFQQMSELDIVKQLLKEWEIEPLLELQADSFKSRRYRVQYAESDFAFLSRMLEDAGITLVLRQVEEKTRVVLSDAPERRDPRATPLLVNPNTAEHLAFEAATRLETRQRVRPGRYTVRDHDYRRPADFALAASAESGLPRERRLERFHYVPGAFLFGGATRDNPAADDRGATRTDEGEAQRLAARRLAAKRGAARRTTFATNALDLAPGSVLRLTDHPREDIEAQAWLVVATTLAGDGDWPLTCEVVRADTPYRPALSTPRPRISGVESATVVGPAGEEIHTDEFGRVRVQFHWDREGERNEKSSCWIHVSQPWSGSGFGAINLPRIGQEVLVDFLGGDPDRPVITGRVHTQTEAVPYALPANKTQSGWRTQSSPNTGGYNEIRFEDAAGREHMHVRAELDRSTRVNHDCETSIGNDRGVAIARDDQTAVSRDQSLHVDGNRGITIGGEERHIVWGDTFNSTLASRHFFALETFESRANKHVFESTTSIQLKCGSSSILITPSFIIVQSDYVYINPGQAALDAAVENGTAPPTPQQVEAVRQEVARLAAIRQRLAEERAFVGRSFSPEPRDGDPHHPRRIRDEMAVAGMRGNGPREGTPEFNRAFQERMQSARTEYQTQRDARVEEIARMRVQRDGVSADDIRRAVEGGR